MKKIRNIIAVVLAFCIMITASNIHAAYESTGYNITAYDVDIYVTEGNVLKVTEKIDTNFKSAKHGIIRNIPLTGTVRRSDGSKGSFRAKISNIKVSDNYTKTTSFTNGQKLVELKIGDADTTLRGNKSYTISYDYALGDDKVSDYDELYYNIIGTQWDTTISNVTFSIHMPKDFDTSKIRFTHGTQGSSQTDGITYEVDGNTITGEYNSDLSSYNGLTVRIELPEGYFVIKDYQKYIDYAVIALFIGLVVITFVLWLKNGKDRPVVETVEFYPPEDLNSAELAQVYKGEVRGQDVTSLLIYLANKGYLKIKEEDKKGLISTYKAITFVKLKEYDGENYSEKTFFDGIFKYGDEVPISKLEDRFYVTQGKIVNHINSKKNIEKVIDKKSRKSKTITTVFEFLVLIVTCLTLGMATGDISNSLFSLPFVICSLAMIKAGVGFFKKKEAGGIVVGAMLIFMSFCFFFSSQTMVLVESDGFSSADWLVLGIGVVSIILLIIFETIMPARTEYGTKMLGKIRGFKRFLETARKEELERLVEENPSYFYDILPYTYVLGVSSKWIKKFETMNLRSPDWYDSANAFTVSDFGRSINNAFNTTNSAMSSSPSSSGSSSGGGGGSSGGGFSGGGSGGGGGSSW